MTRPTGLTLLLTILIASACTPSGDPDDAAVIEQLRQAGADLSQAREVRYYLYLPDEDGARLVAALVDEGARQVEIRPAATGSEWLVLVTETVVVNLEVLKARREEWQRALEGRGGEYDGWEAAAVP